MDLQVEPELEESKQREFQIHVIADHTNEAATTTILKKKQPVMIPVSSFEKEEQKHEREASKQAIEYKKVDHKYQRTSRRMSAAQQHVACVNSRIEETKEHMLVQDTRDCLNAAVYSRAALQDFDL